MPNLENLKKQAKLYLRWHRDRYFPVAAQIRAMLPRFQHLTDQAVLAHRFKLSDAQELIAKKAGFENWEALLRGVNAKGVHTMKDAHAETQSKATLLAAEPQLFVSDIGASCEFYTKKLGFAVAFSYGEPPFYGQVFRDGASLNLRHLDEPAIRPELQDREHLLSASITVDDVKPLFLEFQAACVAFHQTLKTEPWGARTFIVCDPDGNLLLFAGRGQ
jgi:catechol 2,3-dioxygenase-like lactoylglutathione lyase family enzyme